MKNFLLFITAAALAIFSSGCVHAQNAISTQQDSTGLHAYSVLRGDTVVIGYDSAFLLNKKTFALYKNTYQRMQSKDPSSAKLIGEYESLINLQDSMLRAKEQYYQGLKSNFDQLSSTASSFADRTDVNVKAINTSLLNVGGEINNIKSLLDDALAKLKKQNGQKIKVAISGFAVGVGVASLIFLVNK
ncbi:MAG: hypothetical protein INR73_06575 [Williamsia sp.]|nr:hypothetical protein [Williamsia sp.]